MEVWGTFTRSERLGKLTLKGVENYVEVIIRSEAYIAMLKGVVEIGIEVQLWWKKEEGILNLEHI